MPELTYDQAREAACGMVGPDTSNPRIAVWFLGEGVPFCEMSGDGLGYRDEGDAFSVEVGGSSVLVQKALFKAGEMVDGLPPGDAALLLDLMSGVRVEIETNGRTPRSTA